MRTELVSQRSSNDHNLILALSTIPRKKTREAWLNGEIPNQELIDRFEGWSAADVGLVFSMEGRRFAKLQSKRGNPLYQWEMRAKIECLSQVILPYLRVSRSRTNAVFLTLTDPNMRSCYEAWNDIGKRWNRFLANLRKRYDILYVRSWESTKRGYPHVHALIIFKDQAFKTQLRWNDAKKAFVSRVEGSRSWKKWWRGHIDVEGAETVKGAVWYITKEILKSEADLKQIRNPQGRQTLAIMWALGKRSFSMSQELSMKLHSKGSGESFPQDADPTPRAEGRLDAPELDKSNSNSMAKLGLPIEGFEPAKLKFEGAAPWGECLDERKEGQKDGLWSYELGDLPARLKVVIVSEVEHDRIRTGEAINRIGPLDDYTGVEYEYDEKTPAQNAANRRLWASDAFLVAFKEFKTRIPPAPTSSGARGGSL